MKSEDAGRLLSDVLREYMQAMGVENGITGLGFNREDIPSLVQATLPQVLKWGVSQQQSICNLFVFT